MTNKAERIATMLAGAVLLCLEEDERMCLKWDDATWEQQQLAISSLHAILRVTPAIPALDLDTDLDTEAIKGHLARASQIMQVGKVGLVREALAKLAHEQWGRAMRAMLSQIGLYASTDVLQTKAQAGGGLTIDDKAIALIGSRYRLINTDYGDLTEQQQQGCLYEADEVLAVLDRDY